MISKKFNRFISCLLAVSLIVGNCPITAFAQEISNNLTLENVNENQNMFSKSYMYEDEIKTVYVYNTSDGTCKMTGDIIYSNGSLGHYSVRHEDGFIELPFTVKTLEVFGVEDYNDKTGFGILFLTTNNELRVFTDSGEPAKDYSNCYEWNMICGGYYDNNIGEYVHFHNVEKPTSYSTELLYSNVEKLSRNFFLDSNGTLRLYAGDFIYKINEDIRDFTMLTGKTMRIVYDSTGEDSYIDLHSIYGRAAEGIKHPSVYDEMALDVGRNINYMEYKYLDNGDLFITPKHTVSTNDSDTIEEYLAISHLKALDNKGNPAINLSVDNAESVDGNTYTYKLFEDNVTLVIDTTKTANNYHYITSINVKTTDNSRATLEAKGIQTNFGFVSFVLPKTTYSFDTSFASQNKEEYIVGHSFYSILNGKSSTGFIDWNFYYNATPSGYDDIYTIYEIPGSIFEIGLDMGEYGIYDLSVDFKEQKMLLSSRNEGIEYDISSEMYSNQVYRYNLQDIVNEKANCYYDSYYYPELQYDVDNDKIKVTFTTYGEYWLESDWSYSYDVTRDSIESLKQQGAIDTFIDWQYINDYIWLSTGSKSGSKDFLFNPKTIADDIVTLLKDEFDITVTQSDLIFGNNYCLDEVGIAACETYLLKKYYNIDFYNKFKDCWKDGKYIESDFMIYRDNRYDVNSRMHKLVDKLFYCYLVYSETPVYVDNLTISNNFGKTYDTTKLKYCGYKGTYNGQSNLIIESQSHLYDTTAPLEQNIVSIGTDYSVSESRFFGLGKDGALYELVFNLGFDILDLNAAIDFKSGQYSRLSTNKIADNVVKVISTGHYLTNDGKIYTKDGTLVKDGVSNISDNLYEKDGKWYYLDSDKEFKKDYASDLNVRPKVLNKNEDVIIYQFLYDKEISHIVAPDGSTLSSGDTYAFNNNGYYIFEVVNAYGDSFEELIIVNNIGVKGSSGIIPQVVAGHLTLNSSYNYAELEYSLDNNTYLPFPKEGISMNSEGIYYRGTCLGDDLGTYYVTLNKNGKLSVFNISSPLFNDNYFLGLGYIKDGCLYDSSNSILRPDVLSASFTSNDDYYNSYVYLDTEGNVYENGDSDVMPLYRYPKVDFESNIDNPIDLYSDGLYTYLVGDSGNLVKLTTGWDYNYEVYIDSYNTSVYASWYEDWLSDDVYAIKNGIAYKTDGTTIKLNGLSKEDNEILANLENITYFDSDGNEIDITIKTFEEVVDCYYVLDTNLNVYVVNKDDVDNTPSKAEASYYYTIDVNGNKLDYIIENTNWTNSNYNISFKLPDNIEIFDMGIYNYETDVISLSEELKNVFKVDNLDKIDLSYASNVPIVITESTSIKMINDEYDTNYFCSPYLRFYDEEDNFITPKVHTYSSDGTITEFNYDSYLSTEYTGLSSYTYELEPGEYYFDIMDNSAYVKDNKNVVIINGEWGDLSQFIDASNYVNISNSESTLEVNYSNTDTIFNFVPNSIGKYYISIYNIMNEVIVMEQLQVGNIDTYKPELVELSVNNGVITPKFKDYKDETGKTATSGMEKVEYSLDNGTTWEVLEGSLKYEPPVTYNLKSATVSNPIVLLRGVDKAGNVSNVSTISLDLTINESYVYENGKTTVKFYADSDTNWDDSKYSYKYNVGISDVPGYEFSVIVDTDAILSANKSDTIPVSNSKNINIKVVTADKPTISELDSNKKVTIEVGNFENADFSKLYVNVDRTGYKAYNVESTTTDVLGIGTHVIESYYEVEREGQIIKSPEELKVITVGPNNETIIHPSIKYENGKTTLDFYANDDTKNTDFDYSYIIDGITKQGHIVEVTENTIVELIAKRTGYDDGNKTVNLVVLSTKAPNISDLINNKTVTITKGEIVNASLKTLNLEIDGEPLVINSAIHNEDFLTLGKHTIKASQTIEAYIDGTNIEIVSDVEEKEVNVVDNTIIIKPTIEYSNGKSEVTFYANNDTSHTEFDYSYSIDGVSTNGHSFNVTKDTKAILKAEKNGIFVEKEIDIKVIKVDKPTITRVNDDAKVIAGYVQNTNFDKLYIQLNNGNTLEFNKTMVDMPLIVGENIVKAYVGTTTVIDGKTININSDIAEETFTVIDDTPIYHTLTIKDHFDTMVSTRKVETLLEGTKYYVTYLGLDNWDVIGTTEYSGILNEDLVIDFYYKADTPEYNKDNEGYVNIKVIDKFDGSEIVREDKMVLKGTSYSYSPLEYDGYKCEDTTKTGVANDDVVIEFNYNVDDSIVSNLVTLKVVDHFNEKEEIRITQKVNKGYYYNIGSIDRKGWVINGSTNQSGTIVEDTTLHFYYKEVPEILDNIVIHSNIDYNNGSSEVTFFADNDVNHDLGYTYSYEIDSVSVIGHTFTVTNDTKVTVKASKDGKIPSEKELNVKVIKVDKPVITKPDNALVTIGNIKNTNFDKLHIQYNNGTFNEYTQAGVSVPLNYGENIIKAYVSTTTIIDGETININSNMAEAIYKIEDNRPVYYTLTVKDHFDSRVETRSTQQLLANTEYIVTSLGLDSWNVIGTSSYSGKITSDIVIDFYYEVDTPKYDDNSNYVNIKVVDHLENKEVVRENILVLKGTTYEYGPIAYNGYSSKDNKKSGIANENIVLDFYYVTDDEVDTNLLNFKVVDHFESNLEIRTNINVDKGYYYNVGSIDRAGWILDGTSNFTGFVNEDTTLHFYYKKVPANTKYYTLVVKDHFGDDTNIRVEKFVEENESYSINALVLDGWNVKGSNSYSGIMNKDITIDFYYEKEEVHIDKYYTLTVRDHFGDDVNIRTKQLILENTEYYVTYLGLDNWNVKGATSYSGIMDKDITLDFYYESNIPVHNDDDSLFVNIKVYDHLDSNKILREDIKVLKGFSYIYKPIAYNGYSSNDTTKSGVANTDVVIDFYYNIDTTVKTDLLNLKVVDHFGDNEELRLNVNVDKGYYYNVGSIDRLGWVLVGSSNSVGYVSEDTVIHFYYKEVPQANKYYKLVVKDHFGKDINVRNDQYILENETYIVSALSVEGWTIKGNSSYTDVMTGDVTINFYYEKGETKYYTLTIKDHFGDDINIRSEQSIIENTNYNVNALNIDGWTTKGQSNYSGTITENTVIEFYYEKEIVKYYTLTIKDHFGDNINIRSEQSLVENSNYSVSAMNIEGWIVKGTSIYTGTLVNNLIIDFYYEKDTPLVIKYCTLTVKDHFDNNVNVRMEQKLEENTNYSVSALNIEGWKVKGTSKYEGKITSDIVIDFYYENTMPKYYTITVKDHFGSDVNIRTEQLMLENSSYDIKALNIDGWKVVGIDSYTGIVTKNSVIDFYYEKELPPIETYYTLTIRDHFGNDINVRSEQKLVENSPYNIKALKVEGWYVKGNEIYTGTLNKDLVIDFYYEKDAPPIEVYYTLTIKDYFGDKVNVRSEQSLLEGSLYSVSALDIEGWLVKGNSVHSGTISSDLVIEFYYEKEKPPVETYYTLTVKDKFGDDSNIRFSQSMLEGSQYSVEALVVKGWNVEGETKYAGNITKDLVIEFVYKKETPPENIYYDLVVRDHFGDKVTTRIEQSLIEGSTYKFDALSIEGWIVKGDSKYEGILSKNLVIDFYYEKEPIKYYTLTIKDHFGDDTNIRSVESILAGTSYNIKALDVQGWLVEGKYSYTGTIEKDLVLEFFYKEDVTPPIDDPDPDEDPEPPVDNLDDPVPPPKDDDDDNYENPQTGDNTNLVLPMILMMLSMICIMICLSRKKSNNI